MKLVIALCTGLWLVAGQSISAHVFDCMFTHVEITTSTISVAFRMSAQDAAVLAEHGDLDKDGTLTISESTLQGFPIVATFAENLVLTNDGADLKLSTGNVRILNDEGLAGKAHEANVTLKYHSKPATPFGKIIIDPNLFTRIAESRGAMPRLSGQSNKNTVTIQDRGKFALLQCTGKEKYESAVQE